MLQEDKEKLQELEWVTNSLKIKNFIQGSTLSICKNGSFLQF